MDFAKNREQPKALRDSPWRGIVWHLTVDGSLGVLFTVLLYFTFHRSLASFDWLPLPKLSLLRCSQS